MRKSKCLALTASALALTLALAPVRAQSREIDVSAGWVTTDIAESGYRVRSGWRAGFAAESMSCGALSGYWSAGVMRLARDSALHSTTVTALDGSLQVRLQSSRQALAWRPYVFGSADLVITPLSTYVPSLAFGGGGGLALRSGLFAELAATRLDAGGFYLKSLRLGWAFRFGPRPIMRDCEPPE
jgi:hypothetical protein